MESTTLTRTSRTKERIIGYSIESFLKHGFTSMRIDDIADELGMGKATIYRHFSSKEELLDICIDRMFARMKRKSEALLSAQGTSAERIRHFIEEIGREVQTVSITFLEDLRKNRPMKYRKISEHRKQFMMHHLQNIIDQGQRMGDFREDVPSFIACGIIYNAIEAMSTPEFLQEHPVSLSSVLEWVLSIVFKGISDGPCGQTE